MNTIRKKDYILTRLFALSLLAIVIMVIWINGLNQDLDSLKFHNKIYKIKLQEYDSIFTEKNNKIDSLLSITNKPDKPVLYKRIVKKINKDTISDIIIDKDTTIKIKEKSNNK